MKREVMEAADLTIFPEIGIIIFMIVFMAVVIRVVLMSSNEADALGRIPLEDGDLGRHGIDGEVTI